MPKVYRYIAPWIIVLSIILASCATGGSGGSSDPSAEKTCQEGICAELTITQPIVLNQPTNVSVKIISTVNKPGLTVHLQAVPTNVTFGPTTDWQFDAVTNQSQMFNSTVTFTSFGGYMIAAQVYQKDGPLVQNFERVVIDSNGAVVNPTINPNPTSDLFITNTPIASQMLTATAEAMPTPPPMPKVDGFTPQEWLQKCGWTVETPNTISLWPDLSGWLNIKETAILGEQSTGTLTIGFKDISNPDEKIKVKIGLCSLGQGWTTDLPHEWNTDLNSAKPFETPVSLRFTDLGEINEG